MSASSLITDYVGRGTHAARPAAPNISATAISVYYETDTTKTFVWDGSAWQDIVGPGYVGGTGITVLGTIATGVWAGTTIAVNHGGTGLTSGTDGGILGFTGTTTLASSGLLTAKALMVGGGAGATPSTIAALTNGQLAIGSTGNNPVPATITAGSNITVTNAAGAITIAATGGGGAGGLGLFSQIMSATPTASSTGLSTWYNQSTATTGDGTTGMWIKVPAGASGWNGRYGSVPGGSYTITALIALSTPVVNNGQFFLGWTDATKVHGIGVTNGSPPKIEVAKFTNSTTFSADDYSATSYLCLPTTWIQITDDGTNVKFRWSNDGANFIEVFSVAKASGFLGSGGYTNLILLATAPSALTAYTTILSWTQT